jgi:hypothetical protein
MKSPLKSSLELSLTIELKSEQLRWLWWQRMGEAARQWVRGGLLLPVLLLGSCTQHAGVLGSIRCEAARAAHHAL